jgi:5-(carboxyamino)imidazole ribonucleotide synthase
MIRVGILGGGQLARMMALSAYPLGIEVCCFDPLAKPCASEVCQHTQGDYSDLDTISSFIQSCDIITYENENIPSQTLEFIGNSKPVSPKPNALKHIQDRLFEKQLCRKLDIPTTNFYDIDSKESIEPLIENSPLILKTRRLGYDGKGQFLIKDKTMLSQAVLPIVPLIAEQFINFSVEVSLIAVSNGQEIRYYPLTKNIHQDGILIKSVAPYNHPKLQQQAQDIAKKIIDQLNYIGVIAIEFFVVNDNQLLVNEIAPRVHNSGHWTIDGAITSQFENHLRAICHLPLGNCDALCDCEMKNFIGYMPKIHELTTNSRLKIHDYHKEPRVGRKVGHATLLL